MRLALRLFLQFDSKYGHDPKVQADIAKYVNYVTPVVRCQGDPHQARPRAGAQPANLPQSQLHPRLHLRAGAGRHAGGAVREGIRAGAQRLTVRTLSTAGLQIAPVADDPEATLERLAEQDRRGEGRGRARAVLVLPELHLSAPPGLSRKGAGTRPGGRGRSGSAHPAARGARRRARRLARRRLGLRARRGRRDPHTALAVAPERGLVATYRKAFPWQPSESTEPGDRFVVFEIDGIGRAGLAICYDGFFPEVFRHSPGSARRSSSSRP